MILLLTLIAGFLALLVVVLGMAHDELKRLANAAEEANRLTANNIPKKRIGGGDI